MPQEGNKGKSASQNGANAYGTFQGKAGPPQLTQSRSSQSHGPASTSQNRSDSEGSEASDDGENDDENTSLNKKNVLEEDDCYDKLAYSWSTRKKWVVLTVLFAVQISMNFNASVYSNAVPLLQEKFTISEEKARLGQAIFLLTYALGSELWAAPSEEFGRYWIMQISLLLVNLWAVFCGFSTSFWMLFAGRFLGGISSAGGSVTLGMVPDMYESDDQQYAIAFIVLASVLGAVVGPVVGGFIQEALSWRWNFFIQALFGLAVQILHFFLVPETRASVLLDREAKRLREEEGQDVYGPNEVKTNRFDIKELAVTLGRPFEMLVREKLVIFLSIISGISDSLIFTFLEAFRPVYKQWGLTTQQIGLAFLPIGVGYLIGYLAYLPNLRAQAQRRRKDPDSVTPEDRLYWLLYAAPLLPIGLAGFAYTSLGPPQIFSPWLTFPFAALIALANFGLYAATVDYMILAYGPYAASATGGNGLARDGLSAAAALYSGPAYKKLGLIWPTAILTIVGAVFIIPLYVFYKNGPKIREESAFATTISSDKTKKKGHSSGLEGDKATTRHLEDHEDDV